MQSMGELYTCNISQLTMLLTHTITPHNMESKIKANELRIGNYINEAICGHVMVSANILVHIEKSDNYSPIELTEDILLGIGATKSYNDGELHFDRFRLIWKQSFNYWYVISLNEKAYLTKIEYLHEWQNFVFVMNGQELTFIP